MTNATEEIMRVALAHYGHRAINVDASGITLSDGNLLGAFGLLFWPLWGEGFLDTGNNYTAKYT